MTDVQKLFICFDSGVDALGITNPKWPTVYAVAYVWASDGGSGLGQRPNAKAPCFSSETILEIGFCDTRKAPGLELTEVTISTAEGENPGAEQTGATLPFSNQGASFQSIEPKAFSTSDVLITAAGMNATMAGPSWPGADGRQLILNGPAQGKAWDFELTITFKVTRPDGKQVQFEVDPEMSVGPNPGGT